LIGGSSRNFVGSGVIGATIAGGGSAGLAPLTNSISADFGAIGGGGGNLIQVQASFSTIGGGEKNRIEYSASRSTIGGGEQNVIGADAHYSTIGGGERNRIEYNRNSTVGGGGLNSIDDYANYSTIAGGYVNQIGSFAGYSMIAGGIANEIESFVQYAFAAGRRAKAGHNGAFVWADSSNADFSSTTSNQFNIRAGGGVRIQSDRGIALNGADTPIITRGFDSFATNAPSAKQGHGRWGLFMEPSALVLGMPSLAGRTIRFGRYETNGTYTSLAHVDQSGNFYTTGSVNPPSDREVKRDFAPVDAGEVLAKVTALPIQAWSYINSPGIRHLGPVAQDFRAAFGLGADDKTIATVDADGVALAAIQGLNRKLETENAELRARLEKIEQLLAPRLKGGTP
jgi:trimeric autotransporter adhesin